jgi:hypothetical protein
MWTCPEGCHRDLELFAAVLVIRVTREDTYATFDLDERDLDKMGGLSEAALGMESEERVGLECNCCNTALVWDDNESRERLEASFAINDGDLCPYCKGIVTVTEGHPLNDAHCTECDEMWDTEGEPG